MFAFAIAPTGMRGIGAGELTNDRIKDTCKSAIDTRSARCGNPALPQNDDEKVIRKSIEAMPGSYTALDTAIEKARLQYLKDTLNSKSLQDRAAMLSPKPFTEDPRQVYRDAIRTVTEELSSNSRHMTLLSTKSERQSLRSSDAARKRSKESKGQPSYPESEETL